MVLGIFKRRANPNIATNINLSCSPDLTANFETANPNFHEIFDQLKQDLPADYFQSSKTN
jgi:hypothetical protein